MTDTSFKTETQTDSTSRTRSGPRLFWVGMALLLIVVVILGFWPTYFGPLLSGGAPGHPKGFVESAPVIHVHGLVFLGWMALLLTQTVLVAIGTPQTHMRLGHYVATFGLVVVVIGAYITYASLENFASLSTTWGEMMLVSWQSVETMVQFSGLLGLGYVYRPSPRAHKRYMFFATVALVYAATDRMGYLLGPWCAEIMFPVVVGPIFGYDLYTERRIRLATLIGTAILLPHFLLRAVL